MSNKVTQEQVENIMKKTQFDVCTKFDKCTVVTAVLPNGFIMVESSACVSPENYDAKLGEEICRQRIEDKVWMLEGYKLQCEVSNDKK